MHVTLTSSSSKCLMPVHISCSLLLHHRLAASIMDISQNNIIRKYCKETPYEFFLYYNLVSSFFFNIKKFKHNGMETTVVVTTFFFWTETKVNVRFLFLYTELLWKYSYLLVRLSQLINLSDIIIRNCMNMR